MERYDIAITGTGPAGISAAITAKIRNKKILLIGDKKLSKKLAAAKEINNYPGFPKVKGSDLAEALTRHLEDLDIQITEARVNAVYAMGKYFSLQTSKGDFEARSVIIASGVMQGKLLEGEEGLVGNGVGYCATCDAPLYKGKDVIIAGYGEEADEETAFLSEIARSVTYFPVFNGEEKTFASNVTVIKEKPESVRREGKRVFLSTGDKEYEADGVFILRESVSPGQLIPGLVTEGPHIKVDRELNTSISGLFACGDIAGKPYQYIKSAGEGNVAALSAVGYLAKQNAAG